MTDPIEDLLQCADDSARKVELTAPRLADLEWRRRRQLGRRAGAALLLAALVPGVMWTSNLRERHQEALVTSTTVSLESSLNELETLLASVEEARAPIASKASEDVALETFRALHNGAARGDTQSINGMRWLAQRFATTHGGRCARLFLDEDTDRASNSSRSESADSRINNGLEKQ